LLSIKTDFKNDHYYVLGLRYMLFLFIKLIKKKNKNALTQKEIFTYKASFLETR